MKRVPIFPSVEAFPIPLRPLLQGATLYDSSCSPEAHVIFVDKDGGYYIKSAPKGSLAREAAMGQYFFEKRLGAPVLEYCSLEQDWLLTARVAGEDCTHPTYLAEPKRLCDLLAQTLRTLHETDFEGCPVQDRTTEYLATVDANYRAGRFDAAYLPRYLRNLSPKEAWQTVDANRGCLQRNVLLHGDYCLPNILLDGWRFSGFIDLGQGGVGDRHIDLFWGVWTLEFNLGTDAYADRFLDAYGRDVIRPELLSVIGAAECFG